MHNDNKPGVNVSIGATMARPGDTLEQLFKMPDTLLYESKRKGRNCLILG
jgi:PleD family two-component response regulator